jgi:hypothetical protein
MFRVFPTVCVGSGAGQETDTWPAPRDEFGRGEKIPPPAGESRALPKYFEHADALLTADGTDDDKIKLEGVAKGHELCI